MCHREMKIENPKQVKEPELNGCFLAAKAFLYVNSTPWFVLHMLFTVLVPVSSLDLYTIEMYVYVQTHAHHVQLSHSF